MEKDSSKALIWLRFLLIFATIFSGFLAGENMDRYIVQVPAFRYIDINSWAQYSRHADLGNGIILYPFEAIVSFLLLAGTLTIVIRNRALFKQAALAVFIATLLAFLGLFLTAFAAPIMLSIKTMGNDPVLLQQAFNRFHYWGSIRAIMQVLSFCACVWSIDKVEISKRKNNLL